MPMSFGSLRRLVFGKPISIASLSLSVFALVSGVSLAYQRKLLALLVAESPSIL